MLIGKRIKTLRLEKGFSQQELGDLIGVTKVSVCGYENGTRIPSLEVFNLLATVFETSTDYLLGREVPIICEETKKYLGTISSDDLNIISELRHYSNLYDRMLKDPKRFICLINKKMN